MMAEMVADKKLTMAFEAFGTPTEGIRKMAYEALESMPIPTRRTEAWKYTPLNKISNTEWRPAVAQGIFDIHSIQLPEIDAYQVLIVDGHVDQKQSEFLSEQGVELKPTAENNQGTADYENDILVAANKAFSSEGIRLTVNKGVALDKPIHVIHVYSQSATAVFTNHLIEVAESTEAHVIQSFVHLANPIHSNVLTEVKVGDNARLTIDKYQSGSTESYHYAAEEVHQGRDATFSLNTITIDGAWTRNDPKIRLQGQNSICHLNGAYLPIGNELVDNHSVIDHLVPNCESHELYKGVVYDSSKGVFNGKVFVRPDAQKTNAYQQNANIVMSDKASMNSKPELEIYADDVKCSHGSTTGQIDREALFYLQCRGLSKAKAKALLINAFVGEVIEQLDPRLQDYTWTRLSEKIEGR